MGLWSLLVDKAHWCVQTLFMADASMILRCTSLLDTLLNLQEPVGYYMLKQTDSAVICSSLRRLLRDNSCSLASSMMARLLRRRLAAIVLDQFSLLRMSTKTTS